MAQIPARYHRLFSDLEHCFYSRSLAVHGNNIEIMNYWLLKIRPTMRPRALLGSLLLLSIENIDFHKSETNEMTDGWK